MNDQMQTPEGTQTEGTPVDQNGTKPEVDTVEYWKQRASIAEKRKAESDRQFQVLNAKLKIDARRLEEITNENPPTDEEMIRMYPDFAYADEPLKNLMRRTAINERRTAKILLSWQEAEEELRTAQELERRAFSDARLSGKEKEFIQWASHPTRKGVPVDVLVNAFLFENKPAEPEKHTEKQPESEVPPPHRVTLERGTPSGGIPPQPVKKQLDDAELAELRKTNQKEYMERIRNKQI
jgi:hypothetical protein